MPKTVIEKVPSTNSGVTIFKIGGTLGFHEKETLSKLFIECEKRGIENLIMDFTELTSLGGGCAKIIREMADGGNFNIGVAGASKTTLKFLRDKGGESNIRFTATVDDALKELGGGAIKEVITDLSSEVLAEDRSRVEHMESPTSGVKKEVTVSFESEKEDLDLADGPDDEWVGEGEPAPDVSESTPEEAAGAPDVICLGLDPDESAQEVSKASDSTVSPTDSETQEDGSESSPDSAISSRSQKLKKPKTGSGADFKKKIVQYSALLSISSDFNRITDKMKLMDAFLLTTISQVGVDKAAFYELQDNEFVPIAAKGIEVEQCDKLIIMEDKKKKAFLNEPSEIVELSDSSIDSKSKKKAAGFGWVAPVIIYGELCGLVLLGSPIKKSLDEDSFEILRILISQASVAYENTRRFEEESERTLGIVQTLISLIEENTLAKGNTALIENYSYLLAKKMHYPEEQIRNLLYGIVLRDIGMIKVSDLIVRSPRELVKEEWEIIKRHPIDGAEMLRKMKFSEHAEKIVLCHHERYNGEGYPSKLRDSQIPLGARIVSVVESYAAMLQDRPTRAALTREEALNTLKENWGMRYDPNVIQQFVEIIEEEIRTGEQQRFTSSELFKI